MIGVLINPNAKKNRKRKNLRDEVERLIGKQGVVIETPTVDDIGPALDRFREARCRYWMADGGDGSLHWMLNVAVERYGVDDVVANHVFVPANGGTVDYVAKWLKVTGRSDAILKRLMKGLRRNRPPETQYVPSIAMPGVQRRPSGRLHQFFKVGFGNAFAGYGANFYGPFYAGDAGRGPIRIVGTSLAAFSAAAGAGVFRGPLRWFKPRVIAQAEYDFLRPLHADVWVDGDRFTNERGEEVNEFTVLQCSAIPLNLSGVFRVFPRADEDVMHLHCGNVTAWEMVKVMPGMMRGTSVDDMLPNAYDGPARHLRIACHDGYEMIPVLDGELYEHIVELEAREGPGIPMCAP